MKVFIKDFEKNDFDLHTPRDEDKKLFETFPNISKDLNNAVSLGHCEIYSIWKGVELITIIGVRKLYNGVGEIFQYPCKDMIKPHAGKVKRLFLALEEHLFKSGYWRLLTYCTNDEVHNRWMQFVEYQKEGILKKHNYDGADLVLWAKVV